MNKEFIPFEQSKILKHDLDYSGESLGWYTINKELYFGKDVRPYEDFNFMYPAPTFSQAFRWFREKYKIPHIIRHHAGLYEYLFDYGFNHYYGDYESYEEAELACLKKLIEIVKNK